MTSEAGRPQAPPPPRPPNLLRLPLNQRGRDWFVGDMHGEFELLSRFIDKVGFDMGKDRLIAVGDLIDRGPHSQRLLDLFGGSPRWFFSALGNHDAMMREALVYGSFDAGRTWLHNGSRWIDNLGEEMLESLKKAVLRMPLAIEMPLADGRKVGVVHAEIPQGRSWSDLNSFRVSGDEAVDAGSFDGSAVLWGRSRVFNAQMVRELPRPPDDVSLGVRQKTLDLLQPVAGIDLVVMGHTRLKPKIPLPCSNMLWIDTGGGYDGGRLSFVDILSGDYVQLSHAAPRFRRGRLRRPCSLKGWKLTPEQRRLATAEIAIQEEKNRIVLAMFGFRYADEPAEQNRENADDDPLLQ